MWNKEMEIENSSFTSAYCNEVADSTRHFFNRLARRNHRLRKIFFLQRFTEGRYAFDRYEELVDRAAAADHSESTTVQERVRALLDAYAERQRAAKAAPPAAADSPAQRILRCMERVKKKQKRPKKKDAARKRSANMKKPESFVSAEEIRRFLEDWQRVRNIRLLDPSGADSEGGYMLSEESKQFLDDWQKMQDTCPMAPSGEADDGTLILNDKESLSAQLKRNSRRKSKSFRKLTESVIIDPAQPETRISAVGETAGAADEAAATPYHLVNFNAGDIFKPMDDAPQELEDDPEAAEALRRKRTRGQLLFREFRKRICDKLVLSNPKESRVIVLANAGFGKTTLLHRIALAMADTEAGLLCEEQDMPGNAPDEEDEEKRSERELDHLSDRNFLYDIMEIERNTELPRLIPCLIALRELRTIPDDFGDIIADAVLSKKPDASREEINVWIAENRSRLVLLIDGLDELTGSMSLTFLDVLSQYLEEYPETYTVMTARVSGIDREGVQELLIRMRFRGRTILPLNNKEALRFCDMWRKETNAPDDLHASLERIQKEEQLTYLREFMRKPLELVILLQYLPRQSYAAFNRWDLFYNILWAEITSHVAFADKQPVYDDECKFLGYIAYYMQERGALKLNLDDLEKITPVIAEMSFYTDLFDDGEDGDGTLTTQAVWRHLRDIAQNIGVVETLEGSSSVTIPLRSFQEYLAAYACCRLCLTEEEQSPNPIRVLAPHINDLDWQGVLGFAIAGMECIGYSEFERFLKQLYTRTESLNSLSALIGIDYYNSNAAAEVLCRNKLCGLHLVRGAKLLLEKCISSGSALSFRRTLYLLHRDAYKAGSFVYLDAVSYAYTVDALNKNTNPFVQALELLKQPEEYEQAIGAGMLIHLAAIDLGEDSINADLIAGYKRQIPEELFGLLAAYGAENGRSFAFVFARALAELFVGLLIPDGEVDPQTSIAVIVSPEQGRRLLITACERLDKCVWEIRRQLCVTGMLPDDLRMHLRDIVHTIGMFPPSVGNAYVSPDSYGWSRLAVNAMFADAAHAVTAPADRRTDRLAVAVCRYHITGGTDQLIRTWCEDICWGRPAAQIRYAHLGRRVRNHFLLFRMYLSEAESAYHRLASARYNPISASGIPDAARIAAMVAET